MPIPINQGKDIVEYARAVIDAIYNGEKPEIPDSVKELFDEKLGVFVTLHTHPANNLRGCIGFSEPILILGEAVERATIAAALEDPRFPKVRQEEVDNLTVEVSVLTRPELIKVDGPRQLADEVVVGRDGLILEKGYHKGLLLPQVPVEWGWDAEEFLSHTSTKAGMEPDAWLSPGVRVYRFQAQIFTEKSPRGEVVEKDISN